MMKINKINIKTEIDNIKEVIRLIFPKNKNELFILLGLFIFYLSYSLVLAIKTSILDSTFVIIDAYFSFDNPIIYHLGIENIEGHPLQILFTYPIIHFSSFLIPIFHTHKVKTIIVVIFCCYLIASSVIYIFRYIREIINIQGKTSYLLTFFYCFMSTNLILCFTFESFTLTAFFICYSIYYYSFKIKNNKIIPLLPYIGLSLSLGGITITNFAKGIIPIFFTKENFSKLIKKVFIAGSCFLFILLVIQFKYNIIERITNRYTSYAKGGESFYELIIDKFFGSPILFPNLLIDGYGGRHLIINIDSYHHVWQYIFIGILFSLLIASIIKNKNNTLVRMVCVLWLFDITLHVLLKYGLSDPFIYGSHWIYAVPLLLGWLYVKLNKRLSLLYNLLISILLLILIINNLYILNQFIHISIDIFPTEHWTTTPWITPPKSM